jgi:GTP1/Obg family GTP-binding protein
MSSQAQITANRLNAQLSTGPRTTEGKQASSQNARTHGFTTSVLQVAHEQQPVFDKLEAQLRETVRPAPGIEEELFRQLLTSAWQLRRIARWEEELLFDETNPFDDTNLQACLSRLNRYRSAHQRTFDRALKEIRDLQSVRALAEVAQGAKSSALEQIEPEIRVRVLAEAPLARLPLVLKAVKTAARAPQPALLES